MIKRERKRMGMTGRLAALFAWTVMLAMIAAIMLTEKTPAVMTINAGIDANGILTWDPVAGTAAYWYGIDGGYWLVPSEENKLDLKEEITKYVQPLNEGQDPLVQNNGQHTIELLAADGDGITIGEWKGNYNYTAVIPEKPKVSASISKEGILSWKPYDGAARYSVGVNGHFTGMWEMLSYDLTRLIHEYLDAEELDFVGKTTYTVELLPCDAGGNPLTKWTGSFTYDPSGYISIQSAGISVIPRKTYTGKAIKPSVTVTVGEKTLKAGTDYTLTYRKNKNPGMANVTIKGKGKYGGSVETSFLILPPKVKLKSVKNSAGRTAAVNWKKAAGSGYQIQYSLKKNMSDPKEVLVKKISKKSAKLKKLKKGKTYYVRIRAYVTVNGIDYYSSWSAKKKIKIRK